MSILTKIDSIPVFTKKSEALTWARLNGFIGYNKYTHLGELGYMPGKARAGSVYSKVYSKTITVDANHVDTQTLTIDPDTDWVTSGSDWDLLYEKRKKKKKKDTIFDGWQDPSLDTHDGLQDDTAGDDTGEGEGGEGGEGGETDPGGGY